MFDFYGAPRKKWVFINAVQERTVKYDILRELIYFLTYTWHLVIN